MVVATGQWNKLKVQFAIKIKVALFYYCYFRNCLKIFKKFPKFPQLQNAYLFTFLGINMYVSAPYEMSNWKQKY